MARGRRRGANRRKKSGNRGAFIALLLTAMFLVLAFFGLEMLKKSSEEKSAKTDNRQKMPVRPEFPAAPQKGYSSAPAASPVTVPPVVTTPKPAKRAKVQGQAVVAIIVDDMGNSQEELRSLLNLNMPLTFSVIPGLPKAKAVAEEAHAKGKEVMVHIPMEPREYERKPFEKNGLLLAQSDEEIVRRLDGYLRSVPFAVGANNHMGSRFTEDRAKMRTVLTVLKGKGLFFIDSKTSPRSVGSGLAREMGIESGSRSVFLDNEQNVAAIRKQLTQAADAARKNGSAIAICHPHKATIQALSETMRELQKNGIVFAYASQVVK